MNGDAKSTLSRGTCSEVLIKCILAARPTQDIHLNGYFTKTTSQNNFTRNDVFKKSEFERCSLENLCNTLSPCTHTPLPGLSYVL